MQLMLITIHYLAISISDFKGPRRAKSVKKTKTPQYQILDNIMEPNIILKIAIQLYDQPTRTPTNTTKSQS
jgi:hypothetical protein